MKKYVTDTEAFNNDGIDAWIEINQECADTSHPNDNRMGLLNMLISSEGQGMEITVHI